MKKLTLTDLTGQQFPVMAAWIQMVRHPYPHEVRDGANAVVVLSGLNEAVKETVDFISGVLDELRTV